MLLGYIVQELPIIAVLSIIICCPLIVSDKCLHKKRPVIRYIVVYAFVGCSLSLLYLTVLWYYPNITFHPKYRFLNLRPFIWISETYEMGFVKMIQQLALNIGMYVPYGLLLPMVFKKVRKGSKHFFAVFFTTFSIEVLQYFIGRSADIDDVIMNCAGGVLGYFCFKILNRICAKWQLWEKAIES